MGTQGRVSKVTGPLVTSERSAAGRLSDTHADVIRAGCGKYAGCLPMAGARFDFTGVTRRLGQFVALKTSGLALGAGLEWVLGGLNLNIDEMHSKRVFCL